MLPFAVYLITTWWFGVHGSSEPAVIAATDDDAGHDTAHRAASMWAAQMQTFTANGSEADRDVGQKRVVTGATGMTPFKLAQQQQVGVLFNPLAW
jgi:hypothetical protein